jgi:F-type H+-transporting ATPase subunit delta
MKISPQQYAQALLEAVSETSAKDHDIVLDRFVMVLKQNGDLEKYSEIEAEYKKLRLQNQGIKQAEVTFARDIELNQGLLNELNKIVSGKAEFKKKIDDNLIGGLVVKVDDTLLDASVKTQLENLNQQLKS